LHGSATGDRLHFSFPPGQVTPPFEPKKRFKLNSRQPFLSQGRVARALGRISQQCDTFPLRQRNAFGTDR
jgi:hypothetical protein